MEERLRGLEARLESAEAKVVALDVRLKTAERNSPLEVRIRALEQRLCKDATDVPCATNYYWGGLAAGLARFLVGLPAAFATCAKPRLGALLGSSHQGSSVVVGGPQEGSPFEPPPVADHLEEERGSKGLEEGQQAARRVWKALHKEACEQGVDTYVDPASGFDVFTSDHLRSRPCCGSSCRHCPWGHRNVPAVRRMAPLSTAPKSTLYTRKGDAGWTSLYSEQCVLKSDQVYDAIGDVDELNSAVGLARAALLDSAAHELPQQLETIQGWLLDVGSALCTPRDNTRQARKLQKTRGVTPEAVAELETWIDLADAQLQKLRNFILPHGSLGSSALHVARAICRRAERHTWPRILARSTEDVIGVFLNRLSDYLFVVARLDAQACGVKEQQYSLEFRVDRWQRQIRTST